MRDRILVLTTFLLAVAIVSNSDISGFELTPSFTWFIAGVATVLIIIAIGLLVRNVNKRFNRMQGDIMKLEDDVAELQRKKKGLRSGY